MVEMRVRFLHPAPTPRALEDPHSRREGAGHGPNFHPLPLAVGKGRRVVSLLCPARPMAYKHALASMSFKGIDIC